MTDVGTSWHRRQLAQFDLFAHRQPWRFFWSMLAVMFPAVLLAQVGGGLASLDRYYVLAAAALVGGTAVTAVVIVSLALHNLRVFSRPAQPEAIAALRQLVEPQHWASIAEQSVIWKRAFPRDPITLGVIFVWLDQAISAENKTRPARPDEVALARAQARAIGVPRAEMEVQGC